MTPSVKCKKCGRIRRRQRRREMVSNEQLDTIFERTERALKDQRNIPLSPGRVCENGMVMCAGAMLVYEALAVIRSSAEAREFARRVVEEDDSFIEDTGEQIGLDREMVMMTKRANDTLENEERLQGTLEHLRSLRQAVLV